MAESKALPPKMNTFYCLDVNLNSSRSFIRPLMKVGLLLLLFIILSPLQFFQ